MNYENNLIKIFCPQNIIQNFGIINEILLKENKNFYIENGTKNVNLEEIDHQNQIIKDLIQNGIKFGNYFWFIYPMGGESGVRFFIFEYLIDINIMNRKSEIIISRYILENDIKSFTEFMYLLLNKYCKNINNEYDKKVEDSCNFFGHYFTINKSFTCVVFSEEMCEFFDANVYKKGNDFINNFMKNV